MSYNPSYGLGLAPVMAGDPSTWRITSPVGDRKSFSTSDGQRASKQHAGVDIGIKTGTPLLAPFDGQVIHVVNTDDGTKKRNKYGYGNQVVIRRADGTIAQLSHLHSANVRVGDTVRTGQQVGLSGNSGSSTGDHLDYIVVNPQGMAVRPDGSAYRPYHRSYFGNRPAPTQQASAPTQPTVAFPDTPAAPATATFTAPQLGAVQQPAAQQTDWLEQYVKDAQTALATAERMDAPLTAPRVTETFFSDKLVAPLLEQTAQTAWRMR